ncbi:MAG TPA: methyltransferase domain-containing protein [Nitrospirales bacterium]|nr:methyltransferase domain-containing protein [Nitrospirales bacterium]HIB55124.1 methyltransferase domain-containing protein [Nitrospirales bacterium]HIN33991.1 methyltransferase domain-containing protein [Nitrospirales bacterium]HIO22504.1 methyltransferase domain-containing protein [Nitrospirales bacterium]HIO69115.1 methyltransferase domain-containing protein [Nitrospirales bacterium]
MSQSDEPTPQLFFQTVSAYQQTAALKTAIELDLFTAIAEGNRTPASLAKRCKTSERGTRILCDYLTIIGFLIKNNTEFRLTPDSATFLDKRSPAFFGSALTFMLSSTLTDGFDGLTEAVRKGGTNLDAEGTTAPDHPEWVTFARSMVPLMAWPARWIASQVTDSTQGPMRVLDIAAGHGLFGIEIAKANPKAEIVALDWENVLTVAKENAAAAGVSDRYQTIVGSAFDVDLDRNYDLVLLTNFLHHFDTPTCEGLLRRIHGALVDGGRVITLEFIPNEDRISHPAADFGLTMLATTPAGDAYTFAEYDQMFRNAGFGHSEMQDIPKSTQRIITTRK